MPTNRANWTHPDLQSLAGLFFEDCAKLGEFTEIPVEEMPSPYRELLGHTMHMTVTVENYHQSPVDVQVLQRHVTDNHYSRKILLRRKSDNAVVQYGIVRLNKAALSPEVWREIENSQVLRNIYLQPNGQVNSIISILGHHLLQGYRPKDVGFFCSHAATISRW